MIRIHHGFPRFGKKGVFLLSVLIVFSISILATLAPLYAIGLTLSIVFVFILFKNLQAALLVSLFFLPLIPGVVELSIGTLPVVTPQRVLLFLLLIFWLMKKVVTKKPFPRTPLDKFVLFLVIVESLTVIVSIDIGASLFRLIGDIIEYFGLYYIVVDIISTREDIRKVVTTLLLGSFVAGSFGVVEALTGVNVFREFLLPNAAWDWLATYAYVLPTGQNFHRVQGPFGHPIEFGQYIVLLFPIALVAFNNAATRWKRYGSLLNLILLPSNLVLTIARGAMVGFLASLLLLVARVRRLLIAAAVVLVAIVVLYLPARNYLSSMGELMFASFSTKGPMTSANVSLVKRMDLLETGIQGFRERPVLGYGFNASRKGLGSDTPFFRRSELYALENYYLALLIDGGLVLFISQILLYVAILANLRVGYSRVHAINEDKDLLKGLFASSLGLFVALLTVNAYPHIMGLFWVLVALGMRVVMNQESRRDGLV